MRLPWLGREARAADDDDERPPVVARVEDVVTRSLTRFLSSRGQQAQFVPYTGIGVAADMSLEDPTAGLGAIGAFKDLANFSNQGGVLTVFSLP